MNTVAIEKKRIDLLDALRGFALFGIILAHMDNQYFAGFAPPGHENMNIKNGLDGVLQTVHDILIFGKFYTIFSFLFGVSFGIQLLLAKEKGQAFLSRFAWRLLILFIIGLINHIHYRGDILTIYGVLGFFLLLFYKAGNKVLLFWSFFFILNMPGYIFRTVDYIKSLQQQAATTKANEMPAGIDMKQMEKDATAYFTMVKNGDYIGIAKTNLSKEFITKLGFQVFSGRLFVTMGLFILGLYIAKKRVFENILSYKKDIKRWLWITGVFCTALVALYFSMGEKVFQLTGVTGLILSFLGDVFSPALTMVYIGAFILLFQKEKWNKWMTYLAPLGRMGLTTYLMQTMFGVFIFYGYGLNLLNKIGNSTAFAIGIVIFIAQIYFSKWWMSKYYYGPFEWLWRSATYMKLQPMKRKD
jgi:uncharacterized protein